MLKYSYLPMACPIRQPVPFRTIEVVGRGCTDVGKDMGEPA